MGMILNLISGPRNVSTALMYSFAERDDTIVSDEPLYGHYLRLTQADQPHREDLLPLLEQDGEKAVRESILGRKDEAVVLFIKNMAHHLIELNLGWLQEVRNVFLIRDPVQMLPSLIHQIENPGERDAAYLQQARLHRSLVEAGQDPPVLDARELLLNPEGVLKELCQRLELEFDPGMMQWEAGPREEDGPWAPYWYHNLHRSTGFGPYREKTDPFPDRLKPLLEACQPHYQYLRTFVLDGHA